MQRQNTLRLDERIDLFLSVQALFCLTMISFSVSLRHKKRLNGVSFLDDTTLDNIHYELAVSSALRVVIDCSRDEHKNRNEHAKKPLPCVFVHTQQYLQFAPSGDRTSLCWKTGAVHKNPSCVRSVINRWWDTHLASHDSTTASKKWWVVWIQTNGLMTWWSHQMDDSLAILLVSYLFVYYRACVLVMCESEVEPFLWFCLETGQSNK
jgi:hypothetical protein